MFRPIETLVSISIHADGQNAVCYVQKEDAIKKIYINKNEAMLIYPNDSPSMAIKKLARRRFDP